MMKIYENASGRSGVSQYEIGENYITVKFKEPRKDGNNTYKYTYHSAGPMNVEHMKQLATEGLGLNTFISQQVKKLYEEKSFS